MYELRAMTVGEIVDGAIAIYRSCFPTLASIAIVCQGIPIIIITFVTLGGGPLIHPLLWFLALVLSSFGGLFAAAATLWVISEAYLGRETSAGSALGFALGKFVPLFVAGLIKYLLIVVGFVFLVVPGIIIACGYAVVSQIVVLEDVGATRALGRSWELTRGFKKRAFGLGFIVFFFVSLPSTAFGIVAAAYPALTTTVEIIAQLLSLFIYPIVACAFTLFYYDLRVRKEAFDLEVLSRQLTGEYAVPS